MRQLGRGGHRDVQLHDFRSGKLSRVGDGDDGVQTEFAVRDNNFRELQIRIREGGVGETVTVDVKSVGLVQFTWDGITHPNENCGLMPL